MAAAIKKWAEAKVGGTEKKGPGPKALANTFTKRIDALDRERGTIEKLEPSDERVKKAEDLYKRAKDLENEVRQANNVQRARSLQDAEQAARHLSQMANYAVDGSKTALTRSKQTDDTKKWEEAQRLRDQASTLYLSAYIPEKDKPTTPAQWQNVIDHWSVAEDALEEVAGLGGFNAKEAQNELRKFKQAFGGSKLDMFRGFKKTAEVALKRGNGDE